MGNNIQIMAFYTNQPRELKKLIISILKQGLAMEIKRINYVKSYILKEQKIEKKEEKMLIILTSQDKLPKLEIFFKKNNFQFLIVNS